MIVMINGELKDSISVSDRGLQYGDGLFETIAVKNGECEHWTDHMMRLLAGCKRLNIPEPDIQQCLVEAQQLCSEQSHAVLKVIITRGSGGRGYAFPEIITSTRILSIHPWPSYPSINTSLGIHLHLCKTVLSQQPLLAGLKHLNRLEQVIARNEWQDSEISEGLMSDMDGHIIEGTTSNVFAVINGELVTPALDKCGVAGIMRAQVLQHANAYGMLVCEKKLTLNDLLNAEEVFVCNSIIKIWPVRKILDTQYKVIGDMTMKLMNGLT